MQKPKLIKSSGKPNIGDMLYGAEYFHGELNKSHSTNMNKRYEGLEYFYLDNIHELGWLALKLFVDEVPNQQNFMYECPYIGNRHFWLLPIAIMSDDIQKYKSKVSDCWFKEMVFDFDFVSGNAPINEALEDGGSTLIKSFMGHGYTDGTLPNDGSGNRELITMKLDNGDYIVAISHIWYNK